MVRAEQQQQQAPSCTGGEASDTKTFSTLPRAAGGDEKSLWQQWVCGCKACPCVSERVRRLGERGSPQQARGDGTGGDETESESDGRESRPAESAGMQRASETRREDSWEGSVKIENRQT